MPYTWAVAIFFNVIAMADKEEPIFPGLLQSLREAAKNRKTGKPFTQTDIATEFQLEGYKKIDKTVVNRWERGRRRPPSQDHIAQLAKFLELTPDQKNELLAAARHDVLLNAGLLDWGSNPPPAQAFQTLTEQVSYLTQQMNMMSAIFSRYLNPAARPIIPTNGENVLGSSFQKGLFPALYIGGGGATLNFFEARTSSVLMGFVFIMIGLVLLQGLIRLRALTAVYYQRLPPGTRRGYLFGELLFVSLFVMLNTQLLLASITGLDLYGFYGVESLAGTPLTLIYAAAINLAISLVGAAIFHLLWNWIFGHEGSDSVYSQVLKVLLPTLMVIYVPLALFSIIGGETYYLIVLALLFGSFSPMIAFTDPRVRLTEWEAKLSLVTALAAMAVLFVLAIAGMLVLFIQADHLPPHGNHIWTWDLHWPALGYLPEEYAGRQRGGLVWMILAGIAYMLLVVGGYLLLTIYRHQLLPHLQKEEE